MCRLKKVGIILSAALTLSAFAPLTATADEVKIAGDVTGDGIVNLYDAIELSKCIMKDNNFTEEQLGVADYNADGHINLYDVIDIAKNILEDNETWQCAYLNVIEERISPSDMTYSLICIDDNKIPELIIHDEMDNRDGGVYTYTTGVIPVFGLSMRLLFMGYTENAFYVYSYETLDDTGLIEMHDYCTLNNGAYSFAEQLIKHGDSQYMNDFTVPITEEEFNERLAQYQAVETEFEKYSYDEIKEILSK